LLREDFLGYELHREVAERLGLLPA
jgi:hypothetical protein